MRFESELITCPHCGKEFIVNHEDTEPFYEEMSFNQMCPHCSKSVNIRPIIKFEYEVNELDCKDCPHDWEFVEAFPKWDSYMRCKRCGKLKPLNEEEKKRYNVPPKKYFYGD